MVVEDHPGDLTLTRRMLGHKYQLHCEIIPVGDLASALVQLQFGVDVILLDLNLPDSSGLDTVRRIRDRAPRTPIIVFTGLGDTFTAQQVRQTGAQEYLLKGETNRQALIDAITRHIGHEE
jgi:two-component system cell cycle response regulator